ncbi:MAG: CBS domain-containing protein [Betaproteobacteria bacterium]|nr:CBS domain-containing protein [Betaproteobacteria bacterium]
MKIVAQVIEGKQSGVISVTPDSNVYDALKLMAEREVGAVIVQEGDRLVGILSERDYARKVVLLGKASRDTAVRDIMTQKVVCVRPTATIAECMALMTDKRVRHLPVLRDKHVIGVVSIGDVVKETIAEQQFIISQLEQYIMS